MLFRSGLEPEQIGILLEVMIAQVERDVDGIGRVTVEGEKSQLVQELLNEDAEAPGLGVCMWE